MTVSNSVINVFAQVVHEIYIGSFFIHLFLITGLDHMAEALLRNEVT